MDETWVHHFQRETKQQSKRWKHLSFPSFNKAKTVMSAGKVGTLFLECIRSAVGGLPRLSPGPSMLTF